MRADDNHISRLHSEFDTTFHQTDLDPENTMLYDTMFPLGQRLNDQIQKHVQLLRQKSKVHWLQQRVTNTKFFYAKMSMRRHRNKIHALLDS